MYKVVVYPTIPAFLSWRVMEEAHMEATKAILLALLVAGMSSGRGSGLYTAENVTFKYDKNQLDR
ncbi:hypothetical protein E3E51_07060 [Thermococcus sp. 21S7]|nr:hypothetical protein [Thermococcus sp. 21S7]